MKTDEQVIKEKLIVKKNTEESYDKLLEYFERKEITRVEMIGVMDMVLSIDREIFEYGNKMGRSLFNEMD